MGGGVVNMLVQVHRNVRDTFLPMFLIFRLPQITIYLAALAIDW